MRSLRSLCSAPSAIPLLADEVLELHAARLLLLVVHCGARDRSAKRHKIDGLTKMAKLDFFVRYPEFFEKVMCAKTPDGPLVVSAEKGMVRHHYGPWDRRYYHVLAYLEARGLLSVSRAGLRVTLWCTPLGEELARGLAQSGTFDALVRHMKSVKAQLGDRSGSSLKKLIYEVFRSEVAELPLGEVIGQ